MNSLSVILLFLTFFQTDYSVREVIANLKQTYNKLNDASVTFKQKTIFERSRMSPEVNGMVWYKKENKLKVETEDQLVTTDGKTYWTVLKLSNKVIIDYYDPDQSQFSASRFFLLMPDQYQFFMMGEEKVNNRDHVKLKLIPLDEQDFTKEMKIWVDVDRWLITQIETLDVHGTTTQYFLSDLNLNTGISDDNFIFNPTNDQKVIDLR